MCHTPNSETVNCPYACTVCVLVRQRLSHTTTCSGIISTPCWLPTTACRQWNSGTQPWKHRGCRQCRKTTIHVTIRQCSNSLKNRVLPQKGHVLIRHVCYTYYQDLVMTLLPMHTYCAYFIIILLAGIIGSITCIHTFVCMLWMHADMAPSAAPKLTQPPSTLTALASDPRMRATSMMVNLVDGEQTSCGEHVAIRTL